MRDINLFLKEISQIQWFQSAGKENEKYMVLHSVFEAVDDWNQQMFQVWEAEINELEKNIQSVLTDELIDGIFEKVSCEINEKLWKDYCIFVERCHLEEESGLEAEIMDSIKRDVCWAAVEYVSEQEGFFTTLLKIYKEGYWPCSWNGEYPDGMAVAM